MGVTKDLGIKDLNCYKLPVDREGVLRVAGSQSDWFCSREGLNCGGRGGGGE